jgi:ABC-type phosphate transport system substrate-binding protein
VTLETLASDDPIAVVVSQASGQRNISADELRRVFLAKPTNNNDGRLFVPINQRFGSEARVRFDRAILKLDPADSERYWIDQRLRGKKAPSTAPSVDVIRNALRDLPGAISYLALSSVDSTMTVLRVNGVFPREPNYPIR